MQCHFILVTKAFIYQNTHGLYPGVSVPVKTFTDLGVQFGTLEDFVIEKLVPLYGKAPAKQARL